MRTRLSLFCDKLIEAGWLTTTIVVPVLFNVHSKKVFEVDKVAFLRSIALLMTLAWVIGNTERRSRKPDEGQDGSLGQRLATFVAQPLVPAVLGLVAISLLATAVSVWPHGSLWGSYERRGGLYTTLSYVVLFLVMLRRVHARTQIDRFIRLTVVASLPVSLYAIGQRFGLDPVPWRGDVIHRVASTLGNPIFTGAYLVMVVPLALGQSLKCFSRSTEVLERNRHDVLLGGFYAGVVLLHLTAIILTQSRGPLIGLLGGLFFFFLVWALSEGRRASAIASIIVALLFCLLLIGLNLPRTPLIAVREWPYIGRLTTILIDDSLRSRLLMWQGGIEMVAANPLRVLIGYGPESARVAFYPYLDAELANLLGLTQTTGRFHNELIDALVATGLAGLLVTLFLFGSLFYWSLKSLDLIASRREGKLFVASLSAGAGLGLFGPWFLVGSPHLAALTVPAGLLLAILVYLIVSSLIREHRAGSRLRADQILVIALFSAVVSHFIEIQTGIPVVATRTQFWMYAAMIGSLASGVEMAPATRPSTAGRWSKRRRARTSVDWTCLTTVLIHSLFVALLLATLGFDLMSDVSDLASHGVEVISLLLFVWLLAVGPSIVEAAEEISFGDEGPNWEAAAFVYAVASATPFLVFSAFHFAAANRSAPPTGVVAVFYLFVLCMLFGIALVLIRVGRRRGERLPHLLWRPGRWWLYLPLSVLVGALIWTVNLGVVRADVYFAQAQAWERAGEVDRSILLYEHALNLAPRQDHYYPFLGQAYLRKAVAEQEPRWFDEAQDAFRKARRLSPLRPDHYANLGLLYYHWGRAASTPAEAAEMFKTSLSYYKRAMSISPHTHGQILRKNRLQVHLERADVCARIGLFDEAISEARAAKELAPSEAKNETEALINRLRARKVDYWADFEPDCRVDVADLVAVASRWRCEEQDDCYALAYDRDGDGRITVLDLMRVVPHWGWTCP